MTNSSTRIVAMAAFSTAIGLAEGCGSSRHQTPDYPKVTAFHLITLDPGHFHAALVQKTMYPDVDPVVHVYAPGGATADDLAQHLERIKAFNTRAVDPTHWQEQVCTGPDYLDKLLAEKPGNVVVIAGNSAKRTEYLSRCLQGGLNVLADKPMAISQKDFEKLPDAFATAAKNRVMIMDIMTERYEITSILQRELARQPAIFGTLVQGTRQEPAISMASVHFFSKLVAGSPLKRPAWYYDVKQQGEGLVDVGTHLVDLVQWEAFPDRPLTPADAHVAEARHWTTPITLAQFQKSTGENQFPEFLTPDLKDGVLQVYANGEMTYQLRGVWCHVKVTWEWEAAAGGDTHYSSLRGSQSRLVIKQGAQQSYKPVLYVEKSANSATGDPAFEGHLKDAIGSLQAKYPGIGFKRDGADWMIIIPESYDVGHEAHAAQVTRSFLHYLREGRMPEWEMPNLMTKYDTLRQAYTLCHQ